MLRKLDFPNNTYEYVNYMNYIYICYRLFIRTNNCEGDYVYVAVTIIVGDTHAVVFTIIGSY